jgi:hypothetical protein
MYLLPVASLAALLCPASIASLDQIPAQAFDGNIHWVYSS